MHSERSVCAQFSQVNYQDTINRFIRIVLNPDVLLSRWSWTSWSAITHSSNNFCFHNKRVESKEFGNSSGPKMEFGMKLQHWVVFFSNFKSREKVDAGEVSTPGGCPLAVSSHCGRPAGGRELVSGMDIERSPECERNRGTRITGHP